MSLKNKFFSVVASAAAVTAFAAFAAAQEIPAPSKENVEIQEKRMHKERGDHGKGMRGGKHGGMRGGMRGLMGIELTDAQKEQMRKVHEANKPDDATRQEMKTLMQAKRDGTITADQQERAKTLKSQARERHEAVRLQIEGILTAEQRQQLETRRQEMRQKMQERRQMRQAKPATPEKTNDN